MRKATTSCVEWVLANGDLVVAIKIRLVAGGYRAIDFTMISIYICIPYCSHVTFVFLKLVLSKSLLLLLLISVGNSYSFGIKEFTQHTFTDTFDNFRQFRLLYSN